MNKTRTLVLMAIAVGLIGASVAAVAATRGSKATMQTPTKSAEYVGATDAVSLATVDAGRLSFARSGDRCIQFTLVGEAPNYSCGLPGNLERDGLVSARQIDDGPVVIYGVRPQAAARTVIRGAKVQESGLLFSTTVPASLDVTVDFVADGKLVRRVHQGKAIPTSRHPVR